MRSLQPSLEKERKLIEVRKADFLICEQKWKQNVMMTFIKIRKNPHALHLLDNVLLTAMLRS